MSNEIKKTENQSVVTESETVQTIDKVFIILDIDKCQKIRALSGTLPYNNTKEGSRHHGKFYRTFLYGGKAFTVISDDAFCSDFDNDNLFEVELSSEDEQLSFVAHRSLSRAMNAHKSKITMKAFTVEYVQTQRAVDLEDLA